MTDKRKVLENAEHYFVVTDEYGKNSRENVGQQLKFIPSERARIAIEMVVKWGMVSAEDGGEDSAGRSKMAPLDPKEIVSRAVRTADLLMNELEYRGWMLKAPHPDELTLDGETE